MRENARHQQALVPHVPQGVVAHLTLGAQSPEILQGHHPMGEGAVLGEAHEQKHQIALQILAQIMGAVPDRVADQALPLGGNRGFQDELGHGRSPVLFRHGYILQVLCRI
jgi:hypothetical protein